MAEHKLLKVPLIESYPILTPSLLQHVKCEDHHSGFSSEQNAGSGAVIKTVMHFMRHYGCCPEYIIQASKQLFVRALSRNAKGGA